MERISGSIERFKKPDGIDTAAQAIRSAIDINFQPNLFFQGDDLQKAALEARAEIDKIKAEKNLAERTYKDIQMVVEEAIKNVVDHSDASILKVSFKFADNLLVITIEDNGSEFDPTNHEDKTNSDDEIGGLGIRLIREKTDTQIYKRINPWNRLILGKQLEFAN